jgi:hypothetical protein
LVTSPEPDCWLHADVEVRTSRIEGRGLFALARIPAGTVVSRAGGRLVTGTELRAAFDAAALVPARPYVNTYTVDDDLHLILPPRRPNGYGNHSSDPNLWWIDETTGNAPTSKDATEITGPRDCSSASEPPAHQPSLGPDHAPATNPAPPTVHGPSPSRTMTSGGPAESTRMEHVVLSEVRVCAN